MYSFMRSSRHPADYILVKKIADGKLFRAFPDEIPDGYRIVTEVEIESRLIYDENGRLLPQYWALQRIRAQI